MASKFYLGDVVQMRKAHPCGSDQWEVLRTGMDFRIRCLGCGHLVMLPRRRFERAVRRVVRRVMTEQPGTAPEPTGPAATAAPGPAPSFPPRPPKRTRSFPQEH